MEYDILISSLVSESNTIRCAVNEIISNNQYHYFPINEICILPQHCQKATVGIYLELDFLIDLR